jgi:hypothetical protein
VGKGCAHVHTLFDIDDKPEKEIAAQVETLASGQSGVVSRIDALYTYALRQMRDFVNASIRGTRLRLRVVNANS